LAYSLLNNRMLGGLKMGFAIHLVVNVVPFTSIRYILNSNVELSKPKRMHFLAITLTNKPTLVRYIM